MNYEITKLSFFLLLQFLIERMIKRKKIILNQYSGPLGTSPVSISYKIFEYSGTSPFVLYSAS